jgi:cytochrome c-type biogenesis protein CcmE
MRRFAAAAATVCVLVAAVSVSALAAEGKVYGKGVNASEVVAISDLLANPDKYAGKTVRVEGLITDVCPKRGCWMDLASDKEFQTVRIKVDDGEIVFPLDAKGKQAVAEGVFTKTEITKDQALEHAKHLAEEKGEKFDPETAKDLPTVVYQIKGTGAVIR